jgi:hypothetical protein
MADIHRPTDQRAQSAPITHRAGLGEGEMGTKPRDRIRVVDESGAGSLFVSGARALPAIPVEIEIDEADTRPPPGRCATRAPR